MARKGLTQVQFEKFVQTAEKAGLSLITKGGWTKAYPAGKTRGPALGIPNTKQVTRIELVAFESEVGIAHPKPPAATVTQMLNFEQDEKLVLRDFYRAAKYLASLVEAEPAVTETPAEAPAAEPVVAEAANS